MAVAADTANNALWDAASHQFLAFSRSHCKSAACNESAWGERREVEATAAAWMANNWSAAVEVLHGEGGYEMYSLSPWRSAGWRAGLYMAVGSYYVTDGSKPDYGSVYCELHVSGDAGRSWTRVAPHQQLIPLGAPGAFDSRTCYAAPPIDAPPGSAVAARGNTLLYRHVT